jgi:hypothetical protein
MRWMSLKTEILANSVINKITETHVRIDATKKYTT